LVSDTPCTEPREYKTLQARAEATVEWSRRGGVLLVTYHQARPVCPCP
jgi:hypothetical protein